MKNIVSLLLVSLLVGGCSRAPRGADLAQGKMVEVANDNAAMNAALVKGNASLPQFVAAWKKPRPSQSDFAIYARFTQGKEVEYLWLEPLQLSGTIFRGRINNSPETVTNLKLGQVVNVPTKDIGDWMFVENGKLSGGQTSRLLRSQMSAADRADFDKSAPYSFD